MLGALAQSLGLGVALGAILSLLGVPIELAVGLGAIAAVAVGANAWWRTKNRLYTAKQLSSKPFNGKLPYEVAMATETAIALAGDDTYRQRVVGTKAFEYNFEDLRKFAEVADGSLLEVQCALVIEPANPNSRHAVAVTCAGVVLGYIPEFESEALYVFLKQHRGIARVNTNVFIKVRSQQSAVEIDLTRPYRIVKNAEYGVYKA